MTKARGAGRRLASFATSLLVASLVVFLLLNLLPGDVAQVILGNNADAASVEALRREMGLDRSLLVRYLVWLGGMLTGNLGTSALTGESVASLIAPKFGATLWLVLFGMTLAIASALPLGMYSALNRRKLSGQLVSGVAQVGLAIPAFLAGMLLVILFAVRLRWLPANGYVNLLDDPLGWARHLLLPAVSLALVQGAVLTRYVRNAFIDVLNEDYFRTARSIGWTERKAMRRHGLRNAGLQLVTVLGLQLATLLVGAIVVESVFVLPGLGSLLLKQVANRDLPVVQSIVMILVALVLLINAVVDLLYLAIDPRLRTRDGEVAE